MKNTSAGTPRETEGQRLDRQKLEKRNRDEARREKENYSPSDYQVKVIKANVAAIADLLQELTEAALKDHGEVRKGIMAWLRFIKRNCEEQKKRL